MGEARQRKLAKAAGRPWPEDAGLPFASVERIVVDSQWAAPGVDEMLDTIKRVLARREDLPVIIIREPPPRHMPMPEMVAVLQDEAMRFSVTGRPPGRPRGRLR